MNWFFSLLAAILTTVAALYFAYTQSAFAEQVPCTKDPPISLENNIQIHACDVFSKTYDQARQAFRQAASTSVPRAHLEQLVIDPDDDLTVDIVTIPGSLPSTLVHMSGTHGVEGYAGSAIQVAFLHHLEQILDEKERPTIVLIHALNPFGMKHYRRANEHNVDLNRNAIRDFATFLRERPPNVAYYDTFRFFLSPTRPCRQWWDGTIGWWIQGLILLVEYGYVAVKRSLVAGQYHDAQGSFYGGTSVQPSILKLWDYIQAKSLLSSSQSIVWIDVHTGLGPLGKDSLLVGTVGDAGKEYNSQLFPTQAHDVQYRSMASSSTTKADVVASSSKAAAASGEGVSSGYDLTAGFIVQDLGQYQSETNEKSKFMVQEFGTIPSLLVGRSLILENQIYHYNQDKEWGKELMQRAFYPQSPKWRRAIIERGIGLINESIQYLKEQAASDEYVVDSGSGATRDEESQKSTTSEL